jgi:hypothetical protein
MIHFPLPESEEVAIENCNNIAFLVSSKSLIQLTRTEGANSRPTTYGTMMHPTHAEFAGL